MSFNWSNSTSPFSLARAAVPHLPFSRDVALHEGGDYRVDGGDTQFHLLILVQIREANRQDYPAESLVAARDGNGSVLNGSIRFRSHYEQDRW